MNFYPFARALQIRDQFADVLVVDLRNQPVVAKLTLTLAPLVRQDVASIGLGALDAAAARGLETLRRSAAGLDLRHHTPRAPKPVAQRGWSIIDMLRPSSRGLSSILLRSFTFSNTPKSLSRPISGCVISRPRKKTDTFTRCPRSKNLRM